MINRIYCHKCFINLFSAFLTLFYYDSEGHKTKEQKNGKAEKRDCKNMFKCRVDCGDKRMVKMFYFHKA